MTVPTSSVEDEPKADRLRALAGYLRELHGLRVPPVRDIKNHDHFRLDPGRLDLAGASTKLDWSSPDWLVVDLPTAVSEPEPPPGLVGALVPRLQPHSPPLLRDDLGDQVAVLRPLFDRWLMSTWKPWEDANKACERGRRFYLELFAVYDALEADRGSLELVWGFGRVRWDALGIDHPLVVVPMEVTYEAAAARLTVRQAGAPQVSIDFLSGSPVTAPEQLYEAARTIESTGIDPWTPEFAHDQLAPLMRMISNDFGTEGGPTLDDRWQLFVRRRPSGYLEFLTSFENHLESLSLLAPLAALVVADPSHVDTGDDGLASPTAPDSLLLPLPANEEQRRILRFAATAAGVTVEGPPGTGKSHTIANLLCAFLAQGQRVLVTAEKEQALKVLLDKIPEALRPLCVPVLGAGQQERLGLEQSIDRISQAAFGLSDYGPDVIARIESDLDDTRSDRAIALNELRRQLEAEDSPLPGGTPPGAGTTLATLGAWLLENEPELGYIPDPVTPNDDAPLAAIELEELADLQSRITATDAVASLDTLPGPSLVPEAAQLISQTAERYSLLSALDFNEPRIDNRVQLDLSGESLHELAEELSRAASQLERWAAGWQGRVAQQVHDPAIKQMWGSFAEQLTHGRDAVAALRARLQAHTVSLPNEKPLDHAAAALVEKAAVRLRAKEGLGIGHRAAQRTLGLCSVDGRPPQSIEHVELVLAESQLRYQRDLLNNLLLSERTALGLDVEPQPRPEEQVVVLLDDLRAVLDWGTSTWPRLRRQLTAAGIRLVDPPSPSTLRDDAAAVVAQAGLYRLAELDTADRALAAYLASPTNDPRSPLWLQLSRSLDQQDWPTWDAARTEALRLGALSVDAARLTSLEQALRSIAPQWAAISRSTDGAALGEGSKLAPAWQWRQLSTWFDRTISGRTGIEIEDELRHLDRRSARLTTNLVAAKAWAAVIGRIDGPTQMALGAYKTSVARLGKGFSKFAPMLQANVRQAIDGCRRAVPAWIMPIERVLADFRCEAEPVFDVLIIDEASQIPLTRLPVFALAHRVIVVGDDKQMSPSSPGRELAPTFAALKNRLGDIPNKNTFQVNASLYDVALERFPRKVQLTEHFRCLPQIISFSNDRYYGGLLVPLRDRLPTPEWVPTHARLVVGGYRDDDDCNRPEAEDAVKLIGHLITLPEYAGKSFGVISLLGKNQSKLIYDLLFDQLGPVTMTERQIRVGEPALLQGDERDVIVISTVVSDSGGRNIGAMTARNHAQMVNVAASRARDQLWVLHSVPAEAFPRNDERAALIRHCTEVVEAGDIYNQLEQLVDERSPFERDVLQALVRRGYRTIRPQHRVGRYRIDFVIDGPTSRLALECDGDRFHGPEEWDQDRARQDVLERAGWTFVRIRGSQFYRDPDRALQPLWAKLEELGIPSGDWRSRHPAPRPGFGPPTQILRLGDERAEIGKPGGEVANREATVETRPDSLSFAPDAAFPLAVAHDEPESAAQSPTAVEDDPWDAAFRAADTAREEDHRRAHG